MKYRIFFSRLGILLAPVFNLSFGGSGSGLKETLSDNGQVSFKINGKRMAKRSPGHPVLGHEVEADTDNSTMVRIEAFAADGPHLALTIY